MLFPLPFERVYIVDFEFKANPGELQLPICVAFHEILSGETKSFWLEGRETPECPYVIDEKTLFVAYYSSAEWNCHLSLNWPLPEHVVDLFAEFRRISNGLPGVSKGLLGACKFFGIAAISESEKGQMREKILNGGPYSETDRQEILTYCESDIVETAELFKQIVARRDFDLKTALFRGRYMESVAMMEFNGIPIDRETLSGLKTNWDAIKLKLIEETDLEYGVYEGVSFKISKFQKYLEMAGIPWPVTEKNNLKLDENTFKEMAKISPQLQNLKELRYTLGQLNLHDLPIGSDRRNRCMISPFRSKTGRNQPSNAKFIFGPSVWLRSLIQPEPGKVLAYIDYEQQEFCIAAVLSEDLEMKRAYDSGDPYLAFAKLSGAVPPEATKETHSVTRDLFKQCVLGVQYGMGSESLAFRIGRPAPYAGELLKHHKRVFKTFWAWKEQVLNSALLAKRVQNSLGWGLSLFGQDKKEIRTLQNFPIQSMGAEVLHAACIRLMEARVKILAPVHDAVLIEVDEVNAEEDIKKAQEIMEQASEFILGEGNRIRTEAKVIYHPDRYSDKRGVETWGRIMKILNEILDSTETQQGKEPIA